MMRCPFCGHNETQVKDSRPSEENAVIRRRRACIICSARFTTLERIQLRELQVMKGDKSVEPFERDKLLRSVSIATRKRNVSDERINLLINSIVRRLESMGEHEILSKTIGEMVMEALSQLDKVAYIRFASVYRNFREASDFEEIIADVKDDTNNSADSENLSQDSSKI